MAEYTLEQQQAIALASARARAAQSQEPARYAYTGDIPTPITAQQQATPDNSKLVNFLSGGRSGNWEQYLYNNEPPANTTLGKVGQLLDAFGIQGLTGVPPVGQVGSGILTVGSKAANVINMPVNAAKSIIGELAPSSMRGGYEVAKAKNPLYSREFNLGKAEGLSAEDIAKAKSGIANYFRAFFPEANKVDVAKATSMSKEAGGVWDVAKKAAEAEQKMNRVGGRYNMTLPKDATIVLPQSIQSAQQAGMTAAKARQIGKEATWFPNLITLQDVVKKPLHFAGLASPRINANAGYLAGKGENAYQMLPRLSEEDLLNLGLLAPRLQDRGQ
jgi:hypothetical protein